MSNIFDTVGICCRTHSRLSETQCRAVVESLLTKTGYGGAINALDKIN